MHVKPSELSMEVIDGVHRYPRSGLRIVIVGAGVGGLLAALECWRKGHEVVVLERAEKMSSIGDCFTITPPALVSLHKYPKMHLRYNEKMYDSPVSFWSMDGKKIFQQEVEYHTLGDHAAAAHQKRISFQKHRAEFADMLLQQAARIGVPVYWGRKVTFYEEDVLSGLARVRTESSETFVGDIVVAADGIHTKSHNVVLGNPLPTYPSGYSVSRVSWPREAIAAGTKGYAILPGLQERPQFRIYGGEGMHLMLMLNQDWCGIAFTHPDKEGTSAESWSNFITNKQLIDALKEYGGDWDESVLDLLSQIPQSSKIVDWKLNWRDPNPKWTSDGGRIIQLGDAAHAFVPSSGTGATQAMEDGISLAECLRIGGKEGAPWATKVHQLLRYERVSLLQKSGFISRERLHHSLEFLTHPDPEVKASVSSLNRMGGWLWNHSPEIYATENYQAALEHLKHGSGFKNTNIPEGTSTEPWTIEQVVEEEKALRAQTNGAVARVTA